MAFGIRYKQPASDKGVASNGTTAVTVFTFGTGLKNPDGSAGYGGIVDNVGLYNSDTVPHGVLLHLVADGATRGNDTVIERVVLQPKEFYRYPGPARALDEAVLEIILEEAHTATAVYAKAEISEVHA